MDIQYLDNGESIMFISTWLTDSKIENIVSKEGRAIEIRSQKREAEKKKIKLNKF